MTVLKAALLAFFVAFVKATLLPTQPIADTIWDARKTQTLTWIDDGKAPDLTIIGKLGIHLFAGSTYQQSFLQDLTGPRYINAARGTTTVTIDPTVGPSGQYYFLRFSADALLTDVYTAHFTINHMSGTFNSTVLGQIAAGNTSSASESSVLPTAAIKINSDGMSISTSSILESAGLNVIGSSLSAGPSASASASTTHSGTGQLSAKQAFFLGATLLAIPVYLAL